jgi:hypothetical protein
MAIITSFCAASPLLIPAEKSSLSSIIFLNDTSVTRLRSFSYSSCICFLHFFHSNSSSLLLLLFDVTGQQRDGSKTRIDPAHSAALARLHQVARAALVPLPRYFYRYVRAHEQ